MRPYFGCACLLAAIVCHAPWVAAERAPLSPERKQQEATHIVTGKVEAIYRQEKPIEEFGGDPLVVNTVRTNIVVQLSGITVEKGEGLKAKSRLYVHCFKLKDAIIGHNGHHPIPEEGDQVRVFLVRRTDGGFDVVYPNGVERLGAADRGGPRLEKPVQLLAVKKPISVEGGHAAPFYADIDGSGQPALLVGQFGDGKLRIYQNHGTAAEPRFEDFTWFQAGGQDGKIPIH